MKLDLRGAYITRAVAAGPHGCAEIITDGVQKTSDKIYAFFEDMSAADMPVMIAALRIVEQALSDSSIAKQTNAIRTADEICARIGHETTETIISVKKDLGDIRNEE